jgi:hypothetical protein
MESGLLDFVPQTQVISGLQLNSTARLMLKIYCFADRWVQSYMKINIIAWTALLLLVCGALGLPQSRFSGWDSVKRHSPDIILARCVKTVDDPRLSQRVRSVIFSDIEVLSSFRGRTNLGPAQLRSITWPRQGEYYLLFSHYMEGKYYAVEKYCAVPLGTYMPPDLLAGKTLDENIQILFQRRLDDLNRQMKEEQEEKQRLEEGLKK